MKMKRDNEKKRKEKGGKQEKQKQRQQSGRLDSRWRCCYSLSLREQTSLLSCFQVLLWSLPLSVQECAESITSVQASIGQRAPPAAAPPLRSFLNPFGASSAPPVSCRECASLCRTTEGNEAVSQLSCLSTRSYRRYLKIDDTQKVDGGTRRWGERGGAHSVVSAEWNVFLVFFKRGVFTTQATTYLSLFPRFSSLWPLARVLTVIYPCGSPPGLIKDRVFFLLLCPQVQTMVCVWAAEERSRTHFTWKCSRTPGTTPAFSKCLPWDTPARTLHLLSGWSPTCFHRTMRANPLHGHGHNCVTMSRVYLQMAPVDDPRSFGPVAWTWAVFSLFFLTIHHCIRGSLHSMHQVGCHSCTVTALLALCMGTGLVSREKIGQWSGPDPQDFDPQLGGLVIATLELMWALLFSGSHTEICLCGEGS